MGAHDQQFMARADKPLMSGDSMPATGVSSGDRKIGNAVVAGNGNGIDRRIDFVIDVKYRLLMRCVINGNAVW